MKLDLNVNELSALIESLEELEKILDENKMACDYNSITVTPYNINKNINQEYNTACDKIYKAYNKGLEKC